MYMYGQCAWAHVPSASMEIRGQLSGVGSPIFAVKPQEVSSGSRLGLQVLTC